MMDRRENAILTSEFACLWKAQQLESFLKIYYFIMKNLTDFCKTVETSAYLHLILLFNVEKLRYSVAAGVHKCTNDDGLLMATVM